MENVKSELLEEIKGGVIRCALLQFGRFPHWQEDVPAPEEFILKEGYSLEEIREFLDKIDFEYDNGYGEQYLEGVVWMEDGTWFERAEYDGSEWWEHRRLPEIPESLKQSGNEGLDK